MNLTIERFHYAAQKKFKEIASVKEKKKRDRKLSGSPHLTRQKTRVLSPIKLDKKLPKKVENSRKG